MSDEHSEYLVPLSARDGRSTSERSNLSDRVSLVPSPKSSRQARSSFTLSASGVDAHGPSVIRSRRTSSVADSNSLGVPRVWDMNDFARGTRNRYAESTFMSDDEDDSLHGSNEVEVEKRNLSNHHHKEQEALIENGVYPPAPALSNREDPSTSIALSETNTSTPLPLSKILPLAVSRISEGLIYSVIFPYINEMIHGMGVPEEDVGVWSATAESALMIAEVATAPFFGIIADKYGRRPLFILCVGLWGCGAIVFGLMQSVWSVVLARLFLGLLSGAGVLSRTIMGEICDKSNRVQGFAIFSPAFTVGMTTGPVIGGSLSNPVPRLLSDTWALFVRYPYLLPSIIAGASGILAAVLGIFLVPETLPRAAGRDCRTGSHNEPSISIQPVDHVPSSQKPAMKALLAFAPFQNFLFLYGLNGAVQFSFEALFPLFAFTTRDLGGLGLDTPTIGFILSLSALLSIGMTVVLFPVLHRALPVYMYLLLCLLAYPATVLLLPVLWASHYQTPESAGLAFGSVCLLSVHMILRRMGDFTATLLDTMMFDTIPGPEYLALANSVTFSTAAAGRALGPFVMSYFFSLSTRFDMTNPLRQLVWVVFLLINVPSIFFWWRMRTAAGKVAMRSANRENMESDDEERVELLPYSNTGEARL